MYQAERHEAILKILEKKKTASIDSLCKQTYCSVATMRRDLIELEKERLITRGRGGASIVTSKNTEYSYNFRNTENKAQKKHMCATALTFISNSMSIFLDSSSTVLQICSMLSRYQNISVVTNGIPTAFGLAQNPNINAYIAGGQIGSGSGSVVGEFASDFVRNFKADLAIISCKCLDEQGAYEASHEQALIKQQMIKNSKSTILLCDSSKFARSSFYKLCEFDRLEAVICNEMPSEMIAQAAAKAMCELILAV